MYSEDKRCGRMDGWKCIPLLRINYVRMQVDISF